MTISGKSGSAPNARRHSFRPETRRPPAPTRHILVIEDHDDTRDVLDMLLRTEGYEVTLAVGRPGRAREVPASGRPTFVLVDIFMPRKNGIDTIRELTRDFPDSVCIAMSADGDPLRRNALEFARERGSAAGPAQADRPWVLLRTLTACGGPPLAHALTATG